VVLSKLVKKIATPLTTIVAFNNYGSTIVALQQLLPSTIMVQQLLPYNNSTVRRLLYNNYYIKYLLLVNSNWEYCVSYVPSTPFIPFFRIFSEIVRHCFIQVCPVLQRYHPLQLGYYLQLLLLLLG